MNPRANGALIGSTFERSGPWVQRADFEQAADTVIRSPSARPTSISRSHVKSLGIPRPRRSRSRALTWGADEKVLLALAAAGWPASRGQGKGIRRAGNHVVLVAVAAALLPHGMKRLFNQTRPDRRTVIGPRSRYLFFRRARGRVSVRPCVAHGSAGLGRRHVAHSTPLGDPSVRDWALADASSSSGALGERRCRGIRSRSHSRYPLDSAKEDARANTGKP